MVRIEAKRLGILPNWLSAAVTKPAHAPERAAATVANQGLTPAKINTTTTAAPSGKEPSTVRSGKLKMRKEI